MPDVIVALLEDQDAADRTLAAALQLARLTGAGRINVLVARTPPAATILVSEEVLTAPREAALRAAGAARAVVLKGAFDAWAPAASGDGVAVAWCDVEQAPADAITQWGRRADWIVLPHPDQHAHEAYRHAVHAALFDTDRPVLLAPAAPARPFGRQVAIAWRQDARATRALLAAMRWLHRAERIHVLAGVSPGAAPPDMPDVITEHGLAAELHVLPIPADRPFGEALLSHVQAIGADVLVMGAYAHSPLREMVLGGVTRFVLAHASVPVLMRH